ncbi:MAG: tyrosine-type recombinase/integrase [Proteobacteria bacterium]|nr:tyrosine-type recombinase/integrase [Pseudomonadota bacterium]
MVQQAIVRGVVVTPKSGRSREIPLGDQVLTALKKHRHLRGPLVFCNGDGRAFTRDEIRHPVRRATQRAGLRKIGWHILRHTFASHLALRGAPLKGAGADGSRHDQHDHAVCPPLSCHQPGSRSPTGSQSEWQWRGSTAVNQM